MQRVRIKIAIAVDPTGEWNAMGWDASPDVLMSSCVELLEPGESRYWVEFELPVPGAKQIEDFTITEVEKEDA